MAALLLLAIALALTRRTTRRERAAGICCRIRSSSSSSRVNINSTAGLPFGTIRQVATCNLQSRRLFAMQCAQNFDRATLCNPLRASLPQFVSASSTKLTTTTYTDIPSISLVSPPIYLSIACTKSLAVVLPDRKFGLTCTTAPPTTTTTTTTLTATTITLH